MRRFGFGGGEAFAGGGDQAFHQAEAVFADGVEVGFEIVRCAFVGGVGEAADDDEGNLVELAGVEPGQLENLSLGEKGAMSAQLTQLQGQLSMLEYRTALRDNAEIITR